MAWDSSATMQMTSQYQGMYAQQMGFSQQLSSYGQSSPYGANTLQSGNMMLGGMRAAGHAANIGMTGLGIGAGMGVAAMGGGLLASTGVGIPIAAAGMAMSHVGQHMYQGAEQQQALNQGLRQSFGFRNAQGGHGFSGGDMTQIGGSIREMSHQVGAGGEMTSFRELGNIASKMGQMGFAQGVKDVATFSKKFKEMTDALKTMAKDLGTTMEGAMEFAQAAKGSGVFGMSNAAKFGSIARSTAVSGGLAMSEVTAMAGIGSQISRSVGGLGKAGAMAGMKTIGQIGTATQMGILSEEDIYNATGLTGAEGRQAYAASSLQKTATFLSSGRGRRTLASMAGKDGKLDMNAVDQLMSGNMGVGETMASAQSHLGEVGRANFIRNEGRLRGEAMSKIGGFLPGIQMMQWAKSKGVDINNMDDRSMLFAQRQLGMGRDEVDQAIKMAQEMPRIVARQNEDASEDKIAQKIARERKTQGIEGIKNRFAQAEHKINGAMEKMGQDIFNEGTSKIESFLNKLAGVYVQTQMEGINDVARDLRKGGSAGAEAKRKFLNQGPGAVDLKGAAKFASASDGKGLYESMNEGSKGGLKDSLMSDAGSLGGLWNGETAKYFAQGQSGMSRLKDAGMKIDLGGLKGEARDKELQRLLDQNSAMTKASTEFDPRLVQMGEDNAKAMRKAYAMGSLDGLKNDARMDAFKEKILPTLSKEAQDEYAKAGPARKAQIIGNLEVKAGLSGPAALGNNMGAADEVGSKLRTGGFHSADDEARYRGSVLRGATDESGKATGGDGKTIGTGGKIAMALAGGPLGLLAAGGIAAYDAVRKGGTTDSSKQEKKDLEKGRVTMTKDYMAAVSTVLGDGKNREKELDELHGRVANMESGATKDAHMELLGLGEYAKAKTPQEKEAVLGKLGMTKDQADKGLAGIMGIHGENARKNREEAIRINKQVFSDSSQRMKDKGLIDENGSLRKFTDKEMKGLGAGGQAFLEQVIAIDKEGARTGQGDYGALSEKGASMSVKERRALAAQLGSHAVGAELQAMNTVEERLNKSARGGKNTSVAYALGMDAKGAKGMKDVDITTVEGIQKMAGTFGLADSKEARDLLEKAGGGFAAGDKKGKAEALAALTQFKGLADTKKQKDEKDQKEKSEQDTPTYRLFQKMSDAIEKINANTYNTANNTWAIDNKTKGDQETSGAPKKP